MTAHTMVLGADRTVDSGNNATRYFPQNPIEFGIYSRVTFQMYCSAVTGSPSDWTMTYKFQWAMEHTTGAQFAAAPSWKDFSAADIATFVVGGADWAPITTADANPRIQQRTLLRPPSLVRVIATPSYTGGTSPSNTVTGLAICEF